MSTPWADRDVIRSAGATYLFQEVTTAGDEVLVVDLPLQPYQGCHWVLEDISLIAHLSTRAPAGSNGNPPLTGLFKCPPNTPAVETIAQTTAGLWIRQARPIMLPLGPPGGDVATIGAAGPPFPFVLSAAPGFKTSMWFGWFLRAIVVCSSGTATPGPGAASIGKLVATATLESDDPCKRTAP